MLVSANKTKLKEVIRERINPICLRIIFQAGIHHSLKPAVIYVGLDSLEESLRRIENRVRKGGHNIPPEDVRRRYESRYEALGRVLPYCDEVVFYDNENGFVKVAEMRNNHFYFCNGYHPKWLEELTDALAL